MSLKKSSCNAKIIEKQLDVQSPSSNRRGFAFDKTDDEDIRYLEEMLSNVRTELDKKKQMKKEREYLECFSVWQGKNRRWYTYLYYLDKNDSDKARKKFIKKRILIVKSTKEELDDYLIEYCRKLENNGFSMNELYRKQFDSIKKQLDCNSIPTFETVFQEWVSWKLNYDGLSKRSYDRYYSDYKRFFQGTSIESTPISEITDNELELFIRRTIIDNSLTAKAWSKLRLLLLGVFRYAIKNEYSTFSITNFLNDKLVLSSKIFQKKVIADENEVFTDNEVELITKHILENPSLKGYGVLLLFHTGLRCGELSVLKWDDIHYNKTDLSAFHSKSVSDNGCYLIVNKTEIFYDSENFLKNGKKVRIYEVRNFTKTDAGMRTVILPQTELMDMIIEKLRCYSKANPDNYIFYENNKRIHSFYFSRLVRRICKKIGIVPRSAHKIRKTYSTQLINNGVEKTIVTKQMGHVDFSTTDKYYFFNNKRKSEIQSEITGAFLENTK